MKKFRCLVKRGKVTKEIVRWFTDEDHAFGWLKLEGYEVIRITEESC